MHWFKNDDENIGVEIENTKQSFSRKKLYQSYWKNKPIGRNRSIGIYKK